MKKTNITITRKPDGKIQYLSEVLPAIPTNTVVYKTLTGLGATYGEIKTQRNSIIIEPNRPVIEGKSKDPKHKKVNLLGVYEGIYTDAIVKYIEATLEANKFIKIMTTPESFHKVKDALTETELDIRFDCFLLFDECHKIIKDVDYRGDIALPMDCFFECEQKALVSATPIDFSDPRFEQQGFQQIIITPDFEFKHTLNLHLTNNVLQCVKETIKKNEFENTPTFVFCNSTDTIYALMKQLNLLDQSSVFCSAKSVDKLKHTLKFKKAFEQWDEKNMNHFNWLTSRFYNALDIELDSKPNVLIVTDCYAIDYTMVDPSNDSIQIAGRFRNGISQVYHISNVNQNFPVRTKEELQVRVTCSEEIYNNLLCLYNRASTTPAKDAYKAALDCVPFNKMLDDRGHKNYFAIDNFIDEQLLRSTYASDHNLIMAYKENPRFKLIGNTFIYPLGDVEKLKREHKGLSNKDRRKIIVEQLELLGDCTSELDFEYKRDLMAADSFIVEAYDVLGKTVIEFFKYDYKKLKEAIIIKKFEERKNGTEVIDMVKIHFEAGKRYPSKYIKDTLGHIYSALGLTPRKAISARSIEDFFTIVEKNTNKNRGYFLLDAKF